MTIPNPIIHAYERGRLRDAMLGAIPFVVLVVVAVAASGATMGARALSVALLGGVILAGWRGLSWSRGARIGLLGAALAILAPAGLVAAGWACGGPGCGGWCASVCGTAGVVGGLIIGLKSRDWSMLATGALIVSVAAALGCWPMGVGVVVSTVAAVGIATLSAWGLRALPLG